MSPGEKAAFMAQHRNIPVVEAAAASFRGAMSPAEAAANNAAAKAAHMAAMKEKAARTEKARAAAIQLKTAGLQCGSSCKSVCAKHGVRAGDILRFGKSGGVRPKPPDVRLAKSKSAGNLRAGSVVSRDTDALHMNSHSERSSHTGLGSGSASWMQSVGSTLMSGITLGSRSSISSRRRRALGVAALGSSVSGGSLKPACAVLDGEEVASSAGGAFNVKTLRAALDYYGKQGVKAVALLPLHRRQSALRRLASSGRVAYAPPGTAFHHFLLEYAMRNSADIISNRTHRGIVNLQRGAPARHDMQAFLDVHLIPFTVIDGSFLPNPDPKRIGRAVHHHRFKLPRQPSPRMKRSRSARTI